ncbi:transposase, partial [Xanthomonas campestris pv. campestris]|nr:transposase [Xanthomonas campestris pv. campestris]
LHVQSPRGRELDSKLRRYSKLGGRRAERKGIALDFIEPGRPMQNGFIERFNGSYRRGVLDMHIFRTLSEVREQTEHWLADYNQQIPHDSLGGLTPAEFRDQHQPQTSSFGWH